MAAYKDTYSLDASQALGSIDALTQAAARMAQTQEQVETGFDTMAAAAERGDWGAWSSLLSQATAENQRMAEVDQQAADAIERLNKQLDDSTASIRNATKEERALAAVKAEAARERRVAAQNVEAERNGHDRATEAVKQHAGAQTSLNQTLLKSHTPLDGVVNRLTRMALSLFTVRRMVRYVREALQRAPEEIAAPFDQLKTNISDGFARPIVAMMETMGAGVARLNSALASGSGQKFLRGTEQLGRVAGQAMTFLFDGLAAIVEFVGNNFQAVMTVAAVVVAIFAAKMLLAAGATLMANLPMVLMIATVAALIYGLMQAGVTAEDIFRAIGTAAGYLYAFGYNLVADAYNLFATFAEFIANVFNNPLAAVVHLFVDTFDVILSVVETVAKAIDTLTGSKLSSAVSDFRSNLQTWADTKYGANQIKIARMEKISYSDTAAAWGEKGASVAASLSDFSLQTAIETPIKSIDQNVAGISKAVNMADEDIKALVDVAERRFVNTVNLTSQAPVITVQGQNTGNSEADRKALADTLAAVLLEQFDAGSTQTTAVTF